MEKTLKKQFRKYLTKFLAYLIMALSLTLVVFITKEWQLNFWTNTINVFCIVLVVIFFLKSCDNLTSYLTKTVKYKYCKDILNEISGFPCILKNIRPEDGDEFDAKEYDISFEVFNEIITFSDVPIEHKKKIEEITKNKEDKKFKFSLWFGDGESKNFIENIEIE